MFLYKRNGKKVQVSTKTTEKRIAQMKLAEAIKERNAFKAGMQPQNITYRSFVDRYLNSIEHSARNTKYQYRRAFRELGEAFPITHLSQITPEILGQARNKWLKRGLYVCNRDIQSIKAAMRKAEAWGLVQKQDWGIVKRFKEPRGRLHYFTTDDIRKLLSSASPPWDTIIMLGARAGLRREEMVWLSWEDVDFARNRIHIAPKEDWNPKDYERRWIPLSKDLRNHLEGLKKVSSWVLHPRPTPGSITTYFKRIVKKAGVIGSTHTLRHTFASHLASAGVPLYIIGKLLGHASIRTTAIYSHLSPESFSDVVTKLPKI